MARITTHSRLPCKLYRYQERNPFVEGELEILFRDQSCSNCFYAQWSWRGDTVAKTQYQTNHKRTNDQILNSERCLKCPTTPPICQLSRMRSSTNRLYATNPTRHHAAWTSIHFPSTTTCMYAVLLPMNFVSPHSIPALIVYCKCSSCTAHWCIQILMLLWLHPFALNASPVDYWYYPKLLFSAFHYPMTLTNNSVV